MARKVSKMTRSVLFGTLVAVVGISWLTREMDLDVRQMLDYLVTSFGLVLLVIVLAALVAALIRFIGRNR